MQRLRHGDGCSRIARLTLLRICNSMTPSSADGIFRAFSAVDASKHREWIGGDGRLEGGGCGFPPPERVPPQAASAEAVAANPRVHTRARCGTTKVVPYAKHAKRT